MIHAFLTLFVILHLFMFQKYEQRCFFVVSLAATLSIPTKTQLSNFLGTPGEDYFKGNPKSLNVYFLVIWWGNCFLEQKQTTADARPATTRP